MRERKKGKGKKGEKGKEGGEGRKGEKRRKKGIGTVLVPGFQTINTKLRWTQSQQRSLKLEMIMLCVQHFCKVEVETVFRHNVQLSR